MKNLTSKEIKTVEKLRRHYINLSQNLDPHKLSNWTNGELLELIRYCKKLKLKETKKTSDNQILNEGEQPGIIPVPIRKTKQIMNKLLREFIEFDKTIKRDETQLELPKSKSKYGYTNEEINKIIKDNALDITKFWKAFGVNTCMLLKGQYIYYKCDIERALYKLGCKLGKNHAWD